MVENNSEKEMSTNITRREFLKAATATALGFGIAGCAPSQTPASRIRILWTNDTHGQLTPLYHREMFDESFLKENGIARGSENAYLSSSLDFPDLAKKHGKVGGYAHIAALIEKERAALPDRALLLDAGDAWYGSAIALLTQGKAMVDVMNAMNYDALTLHWELNLGQEAFLARVKESKFAVIAQNLIDTNFGDRILKPSIVKDFGDVRVGIVGQAYPFSLLTTELRDANPGWRMGYQDEELQKEIDRLRKEERAHIVLVLSHMGLEADRIFAEKLSGVDVIVGGHTHDILWKPIQIGKTLIVQAGSHGKFLGELDLEIRAGKVDGFQHKLIPVLSQRIEPDARIDALIQKLYEPHKDKLLKVVGETKTVLYRRSLYGGTTDAFMAQAYKQIAGADVGCVPGWRFGTTLMPGPITVEDIYNAMKPTASPLYKVTLSGRQIRNLLEDNLDNVFNPDPLQRLGGDTLRCEGVKVSLNKNAARGQRVAKLMIGDAPADDDRKYVVATSGGRTQYLDPKSEATPRPSIEELVSFVEKDSPITADVIKTFSEVS
jgi:sulfur-oxidizing protein SoxB